MNKILKYFLFIMLCGCEINTPPLRPLDKSSFSYDQVMQRQKQLEEEIEKNTKEFAVEKTSVSELK